MPCVVTLPTIVCCLYYCVHLSCVVCRFILNCFNFMQNTAEQCAAEFAVLPRSCERVGGARGPHFPHRVQLHRPLPALVRCVSSRCCAKHSTRRTPCKPTK